MDVQVAAEIDGEGIVLREPVQTIQEFLVALEGYYACPTPSRIVMRFGEVPRLNQVELPAEVIASSEPIH